MILCQQLLISHIFQLVVFCVVLLEISCRLSGMEMIMAVLSVLCCGSVLNK